MKRIDEFNFSRGSDLTKKYQVVQKIGSGWEGEVYLVKEKGTGIERAAKVFFPHRNKDNSALKFQATKSHKLKNCSIVTQYYAQEEMIFDGTKINFLISEFVDGTLLSEFLNQLPENKLAPYEALHLIYSLTRGVEAIHARGEYHGDLHSKNIIVEKRGLNFELKVIDMFKIQQSSKNCQQLDVFDILNIFYDILGGKDTYRTQPPFIKAIICGKNRTQIMEKFANASDLRSYIEKISWV